MTFFRTNHRLTKKLFNLAKKRSLHKTKKLKNDIYKNPTKYLTVDELYGQTENSKNDILNHIKQLSTNTTKLKQSYIPRIRELNDLKNQCIQKLGRRNIKKNKNMIHNYHSKHNELIDIDMEYYVYKTFGSQYENYKICQYCKHYDILNIDLLSKKFDYFDITQFHFNPSKTCFSFCIDFIGNRNYHFFIKNIYENRIQYIPLHRKQETFVCIHKTLSQIPIYKQLSESYLWVDDETIIYIANDRYYNSSACYTINLYSKDRKLIFKSTDYKQLSLHELHSNQYILLYSSSYHSDEIYVLDIQENKIKCIDIPVLKDKSFVKYPYIDHINATWYVLKQDKGTFSFMKTMDFRKYKILFIKKDNYLDVREVQYMNGLFVFFIKVKGQMYIEIYDQCSNKLKRIQNKNMCSISQSCYLNTMNLIPESNKLYFYSSSFTKQNKLFLLETDKEHNYNIDEVSMNQTKYSRIFNSKFVEEVVYLKQNTIMITKIYKKGLNLRNCKCLLYGYGAYGDHYDATFNANKILTLCEKGFLVVISQISGDGALGFQQRRNGMLEKKKNTFTDFIYIIDEYLFKNQITTKDKLVIWGRSAGGLLIGAVLNMRPDICKLAILGVPFLSPFLTMSSHKNPLGIESHSEWGNPYDPKYTDYIQSYSPYQNIQNDGNYPHMFIYSNLNDTSVPYTEPYIYYKSLKKNVDVYKNNDKDLYLHIEDKFGHMQGTSLKDKEKQYAILFTFIEKYIS